MIGDFSIINSSRFSVYHSTSFRYYNSMRRRHAKTLQRIFDRPTSGTIKWSDIEALFAALGADLEEREGSRVGVVLFGQIRVFHRPHPAPETTKGAVNSIRTWLQDNGIAP
jgi:hypothetical protein